ncbi:MAG: amidohydrolase family protein [Oscillospiraceae bacterium]|nr:amidohydrolase family protein [Oscillospiraceae bacterium]
MKIIDAHVHYSKLTAFLDCAGQTSDVDYSFEGFSKETSEHEVVKAVCMGLSERTPGAFPDKSAATPMFADLTEKLPPGMHLCLGINPSTLDELSLAEMEELYKSNPRVVGTKIYAGYYHVHVYDSVYDPVYALAEKYDKTIVIHTGETYSSRGLLKYSHPLNVDELAVTHPDLRIVACHMGVPWVFDACEVAAKNPNVFLDISGMLVGNAAFVQGMSENQLLIDRYRQAMLYLEGYSKLLYGTDWPLVPMGAYIDFCKKLVPPEAYEDVFYNNAARVYKLG